MMQRALLSCALVALALLAWRGAAPSASPGGGRSLLLQASAAKLPDCCCELETIDMGNDEELYQKLQKLRVRDTALRTALHWTAPFAATAAPDAGCNDRARAAANSSYRH